MQMMLQHLAAGVCLHAWQVRTNLLIHAGTGLTGLERKADMPLPRGSFSVFSVNQWPSL